MPFTPRDQQLRTRFGIAMANVSIILEDIRDPEAASLYYHVDGGLNAINNIIEEYKIADQTLPPIVRDAAAAQLIGISEEYLAKRAKNITGGIK